MIRSYKNDPLKNSTASIADWKEGTEALISGKLSVNLKESSNKSKYLLITITENTSRNISTTMFPNQDMYEFFNDFVGTAYKCSADVRFILNKAYKTMILENISVELPSEEEKQEQAQELDKMIKSYKTCIRENIKMIKNPILHEIVVTIYSDEDFAKKLFEAPATEISAYNVRGGLAHMIVDTFNLCDNIVNFYNASLNTCKYDINLMRTGALLCNIGRANTLVLNDRDQPEKTELGVLNNEVNIARDMVIKAICKIQNTGDNTYDFDSDLITDLLHMITTSKNGFDYNTNSAPRTKHAMLLSNIIPIVYTNALFDNLAENADGERRVKAYDSGREYVLIN